MLHFGLLPSEIWVNMLPYIWLIFVVLEKIKSKNPNIKRYPLKLIK